MVQDKIYDSKYISPAPALMARIPFLSSLKIAFDVIHISYKRLHNNEYTVATYVYGALKLVAKKPL